MSCLLRSCRGRNGASDGSAKGTRQEEQPPPRKCNPHTEGHYHSTHTHTHSLTPRMLELLDGFVCQPLSAARMPFASRFTHRQPWPSRRLAQPSRTPLLIKHERHHKLSIIIATTAILHIATTNLLFRYKALPIYLIQMKASTFLPASVLRTQGPRSSGA